MDPGARRETVRRWFEDCLLLSFRERILPVDTDVADECGRIMFRAKQKNYTAALSDALIAATARVHGLKVATLNVKHFEPLGVELVKF